MGLLWESVRVDNGGHPGGVIGGVYGGVRCRAY